MIGLVQTSSGIRSAGFPALLDKDGPLTRKLLASQLAIAGNEKVAVISAPNAVQQYSCLTDLRAGSEPEFSFTIPTTDPCIFSQLVAYETGFALLVTKDADSSSCVYTWGDERYSACLGREVTDASPADCPNVVEDLAELPTGPIRKIAAGGYTLLALTEGNDLYAWGGHPGRPTLIQNLSGTPVPVDIHGMDIKDCAIGDRHAIVLATEGTVFVTGDNTNGQLGLPGVSILQRWQQASLSLGAHDIITGVDAGSRTSFILVESSVL